MALFDGGARLTNYNPGNPGTVSSGEVDPGAGGGGGGRGLTYTSNQANTGGIAPPRKAKPLPHSTFNNRRGLLLNVEQLAGPAAPNYLLRAPYVYGRQSLL